MCRISNMLGLNLSQERSEWVPLLLFALVFWFGFFFRESSMTVTSLAWTPTSHTSLPLVLAEVWVGWAAGGRFGRRDQTHPTLHAETPWHVRGHGSVDVLFWGKKRGSVANDGQAWKWCECVWSSSTPVIERSTFDLFLLAVQMKKACRNVEKAGYKTLQESRSFSTYPLWVRRERKQVP